MKDFIKKKKNLFLLLLTVLSFSLLYKIIGIENSTLYSYSFSIYLIILLFNALALTNSISKETRNYQTLGHYNIKKKAYLLYYKFFFLISIPFIIGIYFLTPILINLSFPKQISYHTAKEISNTIRMTSIILWIQPFLNIMRGYFKGHHLEEIVSNSYRIELLSSIILSTINSFLCTKLHHIPSKIWILVILCSYLLGSILSYTYLFFQKKKNRLKFEERPRKVNEPIITNKEILKRLGVNLIPYLIVLFLAILFIGIDFYTILKKLILYEDYSLKDAEMIYSIYMTWDFIINGLLVLSFFKIRKRIKNEKDSSKKEEKALFFQNLLLTPLSILLPITILISFLSKPIWQLLYDNSIFGYNILTYYIFNSLFWCIYLSIISFIEREKDKKTIRISLGIIAFLKVILSNNLLKATYQMGLSTYYAITTSTIISLFASIVFCLIIIHQKYKISFERIIKEGIDIVCASISIVVVLFLLKIVLPLEGAGIKNVLILLLYTGIAFITYLLYFIIMKRSKKV